MSRIRLSSPVLRQARLLSLLDVWRHVLFCLCYYYLFYVEALGHNRVELGGIFSLYETEEQLCGFESLHPISVLW